MMTKATISYLGALLLELISLSEHLLILLLVPHYLLLDHYIATIVYSHMWPTMITKMHL